MRKQLRILCLMATLSFATVSVASAQCPSDTLFWEDFQSQALPSSWINIDGDSLNDNASRPSDWYIYQDPQSGTPLDPNYVAASNSWFTPAGTADNWLITDAVEICDTQLFVVWKSAPFEGPTYMDGYEVLLSTTTAHPDSFTVNLGTWAEAIGPTAQPSAGTVHTEFENGFGQLQEWRLALGPWLGDTVYLAFRHTSTDDNFLMLDDIGVVVMPDFDVAGMDATFDSEYPIVPFPQRQPLQFSAVARNDGYDSIPRVSVIHEIRLNGTSVSSVPDSILGLPGFTDSTASTTSAFIPSAVGNYDYVATFNSDTTDANPLNNSVSVSWEVSDSVYARDDGVRTGVTSVAPNATGIGHVFTLFQTDTVTSVSIYLDNPTVGDTFRASIYRVSNGPTTQMAVSHPFSPVAGFSGWVHLGLEGIDLPLGSGSWLVAAEKVGSGPLNVAVADGKYTSGKTWATSGSTWSATGILTAGEVPMIRLNFGPVDELVGAESVWVAEQGLLFPNPVREELHLRFPKPLGQSALFQLRDAQGRTVHTADLAAGQQQVDLHLPALPAGFYTLHMQSGAASMSWKIVVE